MPRIEETEEMARKVLPIFYVIDTSGSMYGERIASVNSAMHETVEVLKEVSRNNPDAEVKIAALQFSTGADWVTNPNGLEDLEDFIWNDLSAGGVTDLGAGLDELNEKLSRDEFLVSNTGFCIPVIIFMSDGQPNDNWEKSLNKVKTSNKWYSHATKIGIAVGEGADENVLAKVVGNSEAVIRVTDIDLLKKLIKVASVTSSMVNSKSRTSADSDAAVEIIKTATSEIGESEDLVICNKNDYKDNKPTQSNVSENSGWDTGGWD